MTDAEIERLYEREIVPTAKRLEPIRARAATLKVAWLAMAVVVPPALLAACVALARALPSPFTGHPLWVTSGVVAVAIGALLPIIGLRKRWLEAQWAYTAAYKRDIVGTLIAAFDSSWTYDPDRGLPYRTYEASDIALVPFDGYHSEDGISGVRDGRAFQCVEIHTEAWRGRGHNRDLVTVFRGLFMTVALELHHDARVIALADTAEKSYGPLIGNLLQRWNLTRDPLVRLEDPMFEREFVVYASDRTAAHLLLNPVMMARLTALRRRTDRSVSIAFSGGLVTMAVGMDRDLFEPSFGAVPSKQDVETLLSVLSLVTTLIDSMPMPRTHSPSTTRLAHA